MIEFLLPPFIACLILTGIHVIGLSLGLTASLFGMIASVGFDLPRGAAIVCTFGVIPIVSGIIRYFLSCSPPRRER